MKCETIAQGIINAAKQVKIEVPVVVRLTGTNADKAATIIDEFSKQNKGQVQLIVDKDFDKAAGKAVQVAGNL